MKQQTAVEWLAIELYEKMNMSGDGKLFDSLIKVAKKLEKDQIEDAHIEGQRVFDKYHHTQWTNDQAKEYYNKTYNK